MNFFEQQDKARKNTRWLSVLFLLAIVALVALTNLFFVVFPWQMNSAALAGQANPELMCLLNENCHFWQNVNWQRMIWISTLVTGTILLVSLFKWLQVKKGGKAVAEMMGGTRVDANTADFKKKRLHNVVEEMAISANMPVPAVYVLERENGINAFAAGFSTRDAVVAVTRGALDSFDREQLQGVVAHEFSHILNGDMRLNMKLIALLHGIMFITEAGFAFLRVSVRPRRVSSRGRNNGAGPVVFLALGLIIIGAIGTFFGNVIKAAVSRQREFLADASAVQFTRNPKGIADALKIIGGSSHGSLIHDSHGSEISHLFFGSALSWSQSFFATHPPIEHRIKRIDPRWNGRFIQPVVSRQQPEQADNIAKNEQSEHQRRMAKVAAVVAGSAELLDQAEAGDEQSDEQRPDSAIAEVVEHGALLHEPLPAAAAILCLLYNGEDQRRHALIEKLKTDWPPLYEAIQQSPWLSNTHQDFLPVVEIAVSGLRSLSGNDYKSLRHLLVKLIQADGHIDLYEWSLFQLLKNSLDSHFSEVQQLQPKYRKIKAIEEDVLAVIAMVVHAGSLSDEEKLKAYHRACNTCGIYHISVDAVPTVSIKDFSDAVNKLALAFPLLKPRIIKALINAVQTNQRIDRIEKQLVIAISAVIDAPLPDVLMRELDI